MVTQSRAVWRVIGQEFLAMLKLRVASVLKNLCFGLAIVLLCANVLAQMPSGDVVITSSTVWPSGTYALNSLAVENGAVLTSGGGSARTVAGGGVGGEGCTRGVA